MNGFLATRLLVILAMLLSIAGGPVVTSGNEVRVTKACVKGCCCHMACCVVKEKLPAQEQPAPVQQRVGQELAGTLTAAPFSVLFAIAPIEAKRAPHELFADRHAPEPLAAGCIRLI